MAFLLSVLQCLLLSCVLLGPGLTHASHADQQSGRHITSESEDLRSFPTLETSAAAQFKAELAEMLRTSVLQATAEAHSELSSRLSGVQSSLDQLSQLTVRMEAVEKAVFGIQETVTGCSHQGSTQKIMSSVFGRRAADDSSYYQSRRKRQASTETILDLVPTRQEVRRQLEKVRQDMFKQLQQAVSDKNSRLDGLANSLTLITARQWDIRGAVARLTTQKFAQQNVTVLPSRLDWTQTLQKLTKRQEETLQTLSSHSTQLDGVTDSLAAISDQQRAAQRTLSAQSEKLDGAGSSLSVLSERQQAVQRVLSEQSGQLAGVAEVVSRTPVPAGRPSLVTGRLLGEPCRSDTDCSTLRADTVCGSGGLCQCAAGLQPVAGEACRPYPRLSEPCRATSDCRGATELADCADNRCACPHGLFNFNNSECRSGLGIGEPCRRDNDCSTLLGLTCSAGTCAVRTCDSPGGSQYRYRLVGGASCDNGLIQFSFNAGELWQYVCDSDWTQADAAVACRYLGFAGGAPLPWNNTAVDENNFFSVKNYVCKGSERSLSRCRRVYGRGSCAASELAMVQCSEE